MAKLELTESEVKCLYSLVTNQRGRYGFLKSQFDIHVKEYMRELNALAKKLKAIKVDE
jgi:hypothetical protein